MNASVPAGAVPAFLAGDSIVARRIAVMDWSATLGPLATWPAHLGTTLSTMLRSSVPMALLWGANGILLYNDAYLAVLGGYRPELLGAPVVEAWPELAAFNAHVLAEGLAGRTLSFRDAELTLERGGGSEPVWLNLDYSPVLDADGAPAGVLAIVVETTPRVLADREVHALNATLERRVAAAVAERRLFAEVVEGTDSAIHILGRDYRWLGFNRAAQEVSERLFGVRLKVGGEMLDLLANRPQDQAAAIACWRRALSGESFTIVDAFTRPDEPPLFHELRFHPLRGPAGEIVGAFQLTTDVTERQRDQALLTTMFETTNQLQGLVNLNGALERANAAALAAIASRMEDVAGMPVWDAPWFSATPGASEQARAAFDAAVAGRDFKTEIDLNLPVGRRSFLFTMRPMRDQSGRVIAVMPEGVDITDRRIAEEALRQSQKLEAMGQLTGGVAHDFNNVLTPIIAGLDLLSRRGLGGPREQRLIAGALQSAERARTLVQRLLAFARRQPLQPVPVDIAALFANMAELLGSTVGPKIHVVTSVADGLPPALADTNQLEMALLNLGVNARDAMPEGGTLTLAARRLRIGPRHRSRLPQGHYLLLSVADTGHGMDAETLAHAVEPFFSTKGIGRGTGLGLSMVHGLASQLGGALTIQSRTGEGTTVELWLPISSGAPAESVERSAAPARGAGLALVVDDEDAVRAATADMLADLGYDVEEAASAEDALARLDGGLAPDLLVTDHLMPGMTGADLVRAWRERRPGATALIVSGYADAEGVAPDLPRLTKPFRQDELAAAIADAGR